MGASISAEQKQAVQDSVRTTGLANSDFVAMIKMGITAHYVYHNEQGATLMDFSVTPSDLR